MHYQTRNAMKSRKKHICNRMGIGFLLCLPLDRALRALQREHLTPTLEIVPKVAEYPTSQNSGTMYGQFK